MKHMWLIFIVMINSTPLLAGNGLIAYLGYTNNYWQVWTMTPEGNNKKQITHSDYDKSHISWFPGGNEILVNGTQGELSKVNINTSQELNLSLPVKKAMDAMISPDGKHIAFSITAIGSKENNNIWRVDISGENLTQITNMEGLQHEPVWSRDGQSIYFLSGEGKQTHDIWRVSLKNKKTEQLTVSQLYNFDVTLSNNGDMAFSSNRDGNYDIWLQKNNTLKKITDDAAIDSRPALSSNGKIVLFESLRSGKLNIWRKSLITNKTEQLTHENVGARFPVWSY